MDNILKKISLLILLIGILLTGCRCQSHYHLDDFKKVEGPSREIEREYYSTVSIFSGSSASASGVIIRNKKDLKMVVITAWHIIDILRRTQDVFIVGNKKDNLFIETKLLAFDEKADLALLISVSKMEKSGPYSCFMIRSASEPFWDKFEHKDCPWSCCNPIIGAEILVIGSPLGRERNVTKGVLSQIVFRDGIQMYYTDAAIFFGNSGGGMFMLNPKTNNFCLIGVVNSFMYASDSKAVVPGSGRAVGLYNILKIVKRTGVEIE